MNNHTDGIFIGELDLDTGFLDKFVTEDSIGSTNIGGRHKTVKIYVYGGEGPVPHFHIISKEKHQGNKQLPAICVCIFEAKYFIHSKNNTSLNGTFDSNSEAKAIDKYLRNKYKANGVDFGITLWQHMVNLWFEKNPIRYAGINYTNIQPNYSKINGYAENPQYVTPISK